MTASRRFIVVDPGLTGLEGHHLHYSEGIAEAALAHGMSPVVLAGQAFTGRIAGGKIECQPILSARYQTSGGGGWPRQALFAMASRLPAGLAAGVAPPMRQLRRQLRRAGGTENNLGAELSAALTGSGGTSEDLVLLHSVSAANLASLAGVPPSGLTGHLLVVVRRPPEDMDADDPGSLPIIDLLRRLHQIHGAKLLIYADTEDLAEVFQSRAGLPVHPVPPPVTVPADLASTDRNGRPCTPPHLVFIGGARLEKNYHHLPAIIAACRGRARFTVHAGPVDAASDPLLQKAHRELQAMAGPTTRLIEQTLCTEEYWTLLGDADLVLLPYDSAAYGPRSSGILVEALALGIPAVVPAGCWMEHAGGASRTVVMADIMEAPAAVARALEALPALTAAAWAGREAWRDAHSARTLLQALLAPIAFPVAN